MSRGQLLLVRLNRSNQHRKNDPSILEKTLQSDQKQWPRTIPNNKLIMLWATEKRVSEMVLVFQRKGKERKEGVSVLLVFQSECSAESVELNVSGAGAIPTCGICLLFGFGWVF